MVLSHRDLISSAAIRRTHTSTTHLVDPYHTARISTSSLLSARVLLSHGRQRHVMAVGAGRSGVIRVVPKPRLAGSHQYARDAEKREWIASTPARRSGGVRVRGEYILPFSRTLTDSHSALSDLSFAGLLTVPLSPQSALVSQPHQTTTAPHTPLEAHTDSHHLPNPPDGLLHCLVSSNPMIHGSWPRFVDHPFSPGRRWSLLSRSRMNRRGASSGVKRRGGCLRRAIR